MRATSILSVDGIKLDSGILFSHLEAEVCRQMAGRVNKIIIVGDYTKIGRTSFLIRSIDGVDMLISDKKQIRKNDKISREILR